jgi:hypothetical protein
LPSKLFELGRSGGLEAVRRAILLASCLQRLYEDPHLATSHSGFEEALCNKFDDAVRGDFDAKMGNRLAE